MLSRNLEQTLHRALALANDRRHEYATLEHLLLALGEDADATTVLRACGVDVDKLKRDLTEFLDKDLAGLVTERAGDPKPTAGFQRVVQRAAIHVQSSGRDEVSGRARRARPTRCRIPSLRDSGRRSGLALAYRPDGAGNGEGISPPGRHAVDIRR